MLDLERTQKRAIVFLTAALVAWAGVSVYRRTRPAAYVSVKHFEREDQGGYGIVKAEKVDINSASVEELTSIKGVGPVLAGRIVGYRIASGRFYSIEEIRRVRGIGKGLFEKIKCGISAE